MRDHYLAAWENSGRKPEALNVPPLPEDGAYLWAYFGELHRARGSNGFGPSPLSFSDIDAWRRMAGVCLDPWELRALLAIDAEYLASAVETAKPKGT